MRSLSMVSTMAGRGYLFGEEHAASARRHDAEHVSDGHVVHGRHHEKTIGLARLWFIASVTAAHMMFLC